MTKKKKGLVITSCVLSGIIVVLVILGSLFTLQKIDFQLTAMYTTGATTISQNTRLFKDGTSASQVAQVENKMLKDANFNKGANILFMNFDSQIHNIETKNPYVRVERIVRQFPNKIIVYYSEREPVALLSTSSLEGSYYVVDSTLKVLDIVSEESEEYNLPVLTSTLDTFELYTAGETIDNTTLQQRLQTFVTAAYSVNGDVNELYEIVLSEIYNVKSIEFYTHNYGDTEAGNIRCKFVVRTVKDVDITYVVYSIDEDGAKSNLLEKFKYAIGQFKEHLWQEQDTPETYYVAYSQIDNALFIQKTGEELSNIISGQ